MYLKSIEVQGFKSFANKINFKFHNGITGIVGPNGSGKSNVADAVRWVLGEQRIKQLRGASMQDVIFSGTETRKALGYAYVAITLDNTDHQLAIDFDEVTVARRLYRSGESEYSINGSICRLKDVNELFYDTGIGKEGYSIIGQGQIDKILSGKPEERRELFDEAAGIVKFKRRKDNAQKKLESEKQNMLRIGDILSELEKQVEPLEKQAEKAKTYLAKRESLKRLDVNVFLIESGRVKNSLEELEKKFGIVSGDLEDSIKRRDETKIKYEESSAGLKELELTIEQERNTISETSIMKGRLENEIELLKEQIHSAKNNADHLNSRLLILNEEKEQKEKEKQEVLAQKAEIDARVSEIFASRQQAVDRLSEVQGRIENFNTSVEDGKNTIIDILNERASIKSRLERTDTMLEQSDIQKAELSSKLLQIKSDEQEQKDNLTELEKKFEAVNESVRQLSAALDAIDEEIVSFKNRLITADEELRKTQEKYHSDNSRLEALLNIAERYEGYGGSVKKVMEHKNREKGIIGVVADIIKVDKKYENAIETALGGNIQNIVTDNEETAKKMIAFLKDTKGGRATFLPLTSITSPQEFKNPESLEEKGVIGLADSIVSIEPKYRDVARAMLGRILVVDNVDNAVKIARKYEYGIRMVTLEGELLVPGGAISGGAFKNASNLLGRMREIDELTMAVKKEKARMGELEDSIAAIKEERTKKRAEREEANKALQTRFIEQNTARMSVVTAKNRYEEALKNAGSIAEEHESIEARYNKLKADKEQAFKELAESEQREKDTDRAIREQQALLEQLRTEETVCTKAVSEWDVEVEKYRQQQSFSLKNLERIDGESERVYNELYDIKAALSENDIDISQRENNIVEIQKTIQGAGAHRSELESRLSDDIKRKEEMSVNLKKLFELRDELVGRAASLEAEVVRLNAQKEGLVAQSEAKINYMWEEYELTPVAAQKLRDDELTDLGLMKKEVSGLKEQIKRLGSVNVNAIEEYKELMERYTFLKGQHDDLIEAEKTLLGIIEELDNAMRKQFSDKFRDIATEFDKVFKELFGGGKGTLELIEDEDILEAGIRIIAQPPGKKLQNMMQLSGGEKALTAIALLFAIQNLKPSPFCLLDEIEAALDESNVGRFAKYLNKLTKNTQFVVITHRRGTMERADRLYGITMQEKGISALVSVNLIDEELTD